MEDLSDVPIRRQEILTLLPLFNSAALQICGITDRKQAQTSTREKDSFSFALLLKKLYCCWNCSLTQPVLVLHYYCLS